MSTTNVIQAIEAEQLRKDIPAFRPGDTVKVHVKVVEGEKERIQIGRASCRERVLFAV